MSKVLLIIDMQNGFINKPKYNMLKNKINNLIENSNYEKYIYTKFKNTPNSLYVRKLQWNELLSNESQNICVKKPKNSIVLNKFTYGLKPNQIKKIISILNQYNEKEIDICGLQTEACVFAIAFQLFDNDIFPNILINFVEGEISKNNARKLFKSQFGFIDEKK